MLKAHWIFFAISSESSNLNSEASGLSGGPSPAAASASSGGGGGPSSCRISPVPNLYSAKIVGFNGILSQSASAQRPSMLKLEFVVSPLNRSTLFSTASPKRQGTPTSPSC